MTTEHMLPSQSECDAFFSKIEVPAKARYAKIEVPSDLPINSAEEGAVIGRKSPIILAFADGFSPDKRQAAMNSTQFAETYADSQASRKKNALAWYEAYREGMRNCGWFTTSYVFSDHHTGDTNITMDSVVLDVVKMVAGVNSAGVLDLLGRVFDTVKKDQTIVKMFNNNSKDETVASCQIMPCMESEAGHGVSIFAGFECEYSADKGGAWFWEWKVSSLKIKKVATVVNFDFQHYQRNEASILERVYSSSETFFKNLAKSKL